MDNKGGIGSDDEDDGPLIPDLDDVRDEDMAFQVADAPSVAVNRYVAANLHYTIRRIIRTKIIYYQILKKVQFVGSKLDFCISVMGQ